jgi:hypothetical protein
MLILRLELLQLQQVILLQERLQLQQLGLLLLEPPLQVQVLRQYFQPQLMRQLLLKVHHLLP